MNKNREPSQLSFTSIYEEMGNLINGFDWAKTSLGPVNTWSPALTMMVRILLANRFPMLLWWGPDYIQIYNDAYIPVLGVKHSKQALGIPVKDCWREIWPILKPLIDAPFYGNQPTWMEDIELKINRYGFTEETHFTIAYSSVPDHTVDGGIGGVLATVHEITEKVFAERRVSALHDLGACVGEARSTNEVCEKIAAILGNHSRDIPFALFYSVDMNDQMARLSGSCGVNENSLAFAPATIPLDEISSTWPIASVVRNRVPQDVDLEFRFTSSTFTCLKAEEKLRPNTAVALPIRSNRSGALAGVLIMGASPEIPLNKQYRDFFELVANQITAAWNNARNYEDEHNRAEELTKSRQEIYDFFMQVPSPLVVLSGPDYRFTLANPAYEKSVGRSVLGKTVLQAFTQDEVGEFVKLLDDVYQTGQPLLGHGLPLSLPDEDGEINNRIINVAYHPMRETDGKIKGILAVHQDVTEQKNTEVKLTRAKEEAEKASQLKSSFLANMSHEIRTPLGVIMGFSDLLVDANTSASERSHFAEVLKRNGEQLSVIINDILDLSKVEAGELKVDPTTFSIRQIVADIFSVMQPKANEKGIKFISEFSSDLNDEVMTDKIRIKQIISNLVGNAVKFTEKGSVTVVVSCKLEDCVFEIRDTGLGISAEQQEKLFRPFSQVDESNTRKFGGTGLGLTLSKKLAQTLGGDLKLKESSLGNGSTFQFFFKNLTPHQAEAVAAMPKVDPRRLTNEETPLKNLNVLLVEDSEDNQKLISLILNRQGANIAIASNGEEAVTKAFLGEFDIILMDIQMPVMDGYTAAQILRKRGFKKPIIALTAHAMAEVREKCLSVGYTDHLVKPINFNELIKKVGEYGFSH